MRHLKKYNENVTQEDEEWAVNQKKYYLNGVETNFRQLEETLNELVSDFWLSDDHQIEQGEFYDDKMTEERYKEIKSELINWVNRQKETIKYNRTTNIMRL